MKQYSEFNARLLLKLNNLTQAGGIHWVYTLADTYMTKLSDIDLTLNTDCLIVNEHGNVAAITDPEDAVRDLRKLAGSMYLSQEERAGINVLTSLEKTIDRTAQEHWGIYLRAAGVK